VRQSVRPRLLFPRSLQYLLLDFRQTFVTGAVSLPDKDELIMFRGQKVKGQDHVKAEASSTQRCRQIQLSSFFFC